MIVRLRLALGWVLVGVPLAYGVTQTLLKAVSLFG
ncbi:MFS transporter small subunit [Kocuria sabuli]